MKDLKYKDSFFSKIKKVFKEEIEESKTQKVSLLLEMYENGKINKKDLILLISDLQPIIINVDNSLCASSGGKIFLNEDRLNLKD